MPFEAARLGCDAYGSDLNPVAALLTWGALNIVGGGPEVAKRVREAQEKVYAQVDRQITEWGIEHDDEGNRADAYLTAPKRAALNAALWCRWPSWVIGEKTHAVARLVPDRANKRFEIEIQQGVAREEMEAAKRAATTRDSRLICPNGCESTPISQIRGDRRNEYGLRLWENDDLVPCLTMCFRSGFTAFVGCERGSMTKGESSKSAGTPRPIPPIWSAKHAHCSSCASASAIGSAKDICPAARSSRATKRRG